MEYDKENQWWIEYTKLSSGQTAVIMFSKYPRGKTLYYFVTFGIESKLRAELPKGVKPADRKEENK